MGCAEAVRILPCKPGACGDTGRLGAQARSPKDQYLLLKALNEVIVSLARSASAELSPQHQQEVRCRAIPTEPCHRLGVSTGVHRRRGCCLPLSSSGLAERQGAEAVLCLQVLQLLLAHCESEEECRNVVAECLGHLALLHAEQVLPPLQAQAGAASVSMRAAVVTAVKCMLLPQPHAIDPLLRAAIPAFLALVSDPDRRALAPVADFSEAAIWHCS